MIYKLTHDDPGFIEFATAKNQLHLLQSYDEEYQGFHTIEAVEEISDEDAKSIMLTNEEYDEDSDNDLPPEISLFDLAVGDDFAIIGSTDY